MSGRTGFFLLVLVTLSAPLHAQSTQSTRYAGRLLADVLRELQVDGLKIVFSSNLVRPNARVVAEPKSRMPRRILDEILRPHGLEAQPGSAGTLLIVRSTRATARPQAAAAPADTGHVSGRVVDATTGAPIPGVIVMVQERNILRRPMRTARSRCQTCRPVDTTCSCRRSATRLRDLPSMSRAARRRR